MTYAIKEIFGTLQGEGLNMGRRACFVRFAGCNMWSGYPETRDRGSGACALWCDTDFADGVKMSAEEILAAMDDVYIPPSTKRRLCVLTGGEPALQLDMSLVDQLTANGWEVAIETNGTVAPPAAGWNLFSFVDHVTVSPKLRADGSMPVLVVEEAHELKVVVPGHVDSAKGWSVERLHQIAEAGEWRAKFLQPMDPIDPKFVEVSRLRSGEGPEPKSMEFCLQFIEQFPEWRLSLQTHKWIGLP